MLLLERKPQQGKPYNVLVSLRKRPEIHPTAFVAPNACIQGEVSIGKNSCIMQGAQIIAENHPIHIGENCIVLQNAVLRAAAYSALQISNNCLIGPQAHLVSCTLEERVFVATGASIFHGAIIGAGAEIRIQAVVHLKSKLPANTVVPIHWVAVGNPAQLFSPDQHAAIWKVQKELGFDEAVYGLNPNISAKDRMSAICQIMSKRLKERNP